GPRRPRRGPREKAGDPGHPQRLPVARRDPGRGAAEGALMMHKPIVPTICLTIVLFCLAAAGWAQKPESQPGYVPIEELGLFPRDKLEVEINIEGPLLRMIAAGTKEEDPGFAAVMAGLKSIRVQVFPVKGIDTGAVKTRIDR